MLKFLMIFWYEISSDLGSGFLNRFQCYENQNLPKSHLHSLIPPFTESVTQSVKQGCKTAYMLRLLILFFTRPLLMLDNIN